MRLHSELKCTNSNVNGQWLWLSWHSGHFQYHTTAVQIQTAANFKEHLLTGNCIEKVKIKKLQNYKILLFSQMKIKTMTQTVE